jgi:tRNA (adenine37-N6)-methyltransferase
VHPIFKIDEEGNVKIRPIGYVNSPVKEPQTGGLTEIKAEIVVDKELEKALDGIEEFSHIVVLYWLNEVESYREGCRPQGRDDVPYLGQLATR